MWKDVPVLFSNIYNNWRPLWKGMYLFCSDFSSCLESTEIWHANSNFPVFFSTSRETRQKEVGGGFLCNLVHIFLPSWKIWTKLHKNPPSLPPFASFPCLWKKYRDIFLTQKELACQISADSEQLEKSQSEKSVCSLKQSFASKVPIRAGCVSEWLCDLVWITKMMGTWGHH